MTSRFPLAVVTAITMAAPTPGTAQTVSASVTLQVPVNLTQLGPDVEKVRVGCSVNSLAITNGTGTGSHEITKTQELPVSGGSVVTTASLVFSFTQLDNPVGKNATIVCTLNGWSTSQQKWIQFVPGEPNPSFRTTTTVGFLDGSFVW